MPMEESDATRGLNEGIQGKQKGWQGRELAKGISSKLGITPTLGYTHAFWAGRKEQYQSRDKGVSLTETAS